MNVFEEEKMLKEQVVELNSQLVGLIKLCLELGNKNYENNVLVKDTMERLQKKKQELEDLKELMREEFSN